MRLRGHQLSERRRAPQPDLGAADDGHLPPRLDQPQAQPEAGGVTAGVGDASGNTAADAACGSRARAPPGPLHVEGARL